MLHKLIQIFITFLCISLLGCSNNNKSNNSKGKNKILCTTAQICDIVRQIGAEFIDTQTLIRGQLDPHTYQLVKGDNEKLNYAKLIFYNGLELEHGPSLRNYLSNSKKAHSLGDIIRSKFPEVILYYNGNIDPHIWMDISLWAKTIPIIVDKLGELDPKNRAVFQNNGLKLQKKMLDQHRKLLEDLEKIPEKKRFLVTSHDAFNYFAKAYLANEEEVKNDDWQKRFHAPEGLAPMSQLSVNDLRAALEHIKKYNINVIFPESNVGQASIRKLLDAGEKMGLNIKIANESLYGDALGPPKSDSDTYLKMIQHNVKIMIKNFGDDGDD